MNLNIENQASLCYALMITLIDKEIHMLVNWLNCNIEIRL